MAHFLVASLDTSNRTRFKRSMEKGGIYKLNISGIFKLIHHIALSHDISLDALNVAEFSCRFS